MANDYIPRGDAEFNAWQALDTPRSPKRTSRIAAAGLRPGAGCQDVLSVRKGFFAFFIHSLPAPFPGLLIVFWVYVLLMASPAIFGAMSVRTQLPCRTWLRW